LSPVCRKSTVAGLFDFVKRVTVDIVDKVEQVQLSQLCRKWVIFVAWMSHILLTLSPVCMGPKWHGRSCRLSTKSTVSNSTLSPVCD